MANLEPHLSLVGPVILVVLNTDVFSIIYKTNVIMVHQLVQLGEQSKDNLNCTRRSAFSFCLHHYPKLLLVAESMSCDIGDYVTLVDYMVA